MQTINNELVPRLVVLSRAGAASLDSATFEHIQSVTNAITRAGAVAANSAENLAKNPENAQAHVN